MDNARAPYPDDKDILMSRPAAGPSRRHFLKVIAAGVSLPVIAGGCLGSQGAAPADVGDVPAGNLADLPVGSLHSLGATAACIGRDANGIYAMTLTCTHQGCNMAVNGNVSPSGIACTCHGSRFDANGNVKSGPANDPLQHFAVSADSAGNLTVHGGTDVSSSTRLKV